MLDQQLIGTEITEAYKKINYKHFTIYYSNEEATISTLHEILNETPYYFTTNKSSPFIIDGGANIGISAIFFKDIYPQARILCFEPDPNAFKLLTKNVEVNNLNNITLINAALASKEGTIDFYGQLHVNQPDARGNSIIKNWGMQRAISHTAQVKAVKLSSYMQEPIDLLKLDIEGAEYQVMEEIQEKLHLVNEMAMEVHEASTIDSISSLKPLLTILNRNNFDHKLREKNIFEYLPEEVQSWAISIQPHLYQLRATNRCVKK